MKQNPEIPQHVLDAYRSQLESPKAVAAELGITTAEVLARARGTDLELHAISIDGAVWIYRARRAAVNGNQPRENGNG